MDRQDVDADVGTALARAAFDAHADALHGYLSRRLGPEEAQDVVADVFRIVVEGSAGYDPARGSQRAWLFGIATNLLRRHWRTERRRLLAMARLGGPDGDDELARVVDRLEASDRVRRVLARAAELTVDDRDLLVLIAWEGMPHREVADILGIPIGTVGSRLHRIRGYLRGGETHD